MATRIQAASIVTMDAQDRVYSKGSIVLDGDRIVAIGDDEDLARRYPDADYVDARGKALFPGFANAHTHFSMIPAKGIYEELSPPHKPPFAGGLSPIPIPDFTPEEMRTLCQLAAIEAIRSGTTAVLEDGSDIDSYADAISDSGLRLLLCERSWDRANTSIGDPGPFELDRSLGEKSMQRIADLHSKWNGAEQGRIKVGVAAWAPDMCSPDLLKQLRKLQDDLDCVSTIHLNQIWGEVAAVKAHRGKLPVEYLDDVGFLSDRLICAHCRCMEPSEERVLGRCRCHVSFNSCIAARRGLSPRASDMESYGCNIAMGSDNMSEDMIEVARTGLFMERIRREDGRNPTPESVLRWASTNGYQAMEVKDGGSLEVGKKADLILVDLVHANMVPVLRTASCFIHQGQPANVDGVIVDGRWVMRDGVVVTLDEASIVREAQAIAEKAWRNLFDTRRDLPKPVAMFWENYASGQARA